MDPSSARPIENLFVDVRQEIRRQDSSGSCTLLTGSKVYWYFGDRVLIAEELAAHQGWGSDTSWSGIDLPFPTPWDAAQDDKRRRIRGGMGPCPYAVKATDMMGDAMCLADLYCIMTTATLCASSDVFANREPEPHTIPAAVPPVKRFMAIDADAGMSEIAGLVEELKE